MQQNLVDFLTADVHAGDRLIDTVRVLCARKYFTGPVYEHHCTRTADSLKFRGQSGRRVAGASDCFGFTRSPIANSSFHRPRSIRFLRSFTTPKFCASLSFAFVLVFGESITSRTPNVQSEVMIF